MNMKKHTLTLLISALLTLSVVTTASATFTSEGKNFDRKGFDSQGRDREGFDKNGYDSQGKDRHGNVKPDYEPHDSNSTESDSHLRGHGDSKDSRAKQKIVICHVPKGNPANRHTIHISMSAWPAHRDNHGGDFLGSCNTEIKKTTSVTVKNASNKEKTVSIVTDNLSPIEVPEPVHTISGCTGEARTALVTKVQSYYEPIIVSDDALDDATVVAAMSQCLNNGDSADSAHGGHNDSADKRSKVKAKADSNKAKDDSQKNKKSQKR